MGKVSSMNKEELVKKLNDAAKKLEGKDDKYYVYERVMPGRGEGTYRFTFIAKKKKKRGLFGAILNIAKKTYYYGTRGVTYGIMDEITRRRMQEQLNLTPIERELIGAELALIFKRWAETIPQGYIETIGNNLSLPNEDKWIVAKINPDKEIRITIDFVSLKREVPPTQPTPTPTPAAQPTPAPQAVPTTQPVTIPVPTPSTIPVPIPVVDFSTLYVKGSLTKYEGGVSFAIKNIVKPTTIHKPIIVKIDGKQMDSSKIKIVSNAGERLNTSISDSNPLPVAHGETLLIKVEGVDLSPGMHKIDVTVNIEEVGDIIISNVDKLQ